MRAHIIRGMIEVMGQAQFVQFVCNIQDDLEKLMRELEHERKCNAELSKANVELNGEQDELQAVNARIAKEFNDMANTLKSTRDLAYERLQQIKLLERLKDTVETERDQLRALVDKQMVGHQEIGAHNERARIRQIIENYKFGTGAWVQAVFDTVLREIGA